MTKKECKDGKCSVDIPDLSVKEDSEKKVNLINKKDIVDYFNYTFEENFLLASFLPKN